MPEKERGTKGKILDVAIVGGGISAHTAAIYTARANLAPVVFSGVEPDQLSTTSIVENYPGFPEGVNGPDIIENCKKQAEKFGAIYRGVKVDSVKKSGKLFEITAGNKIYCSRTIILSTGASPRTLNIPGEKQYWARGVSTCAICDSAIFRNKVVAVIGGGDSAMEETLALYKFASKIYLIHRRDQFKASKIMQERVLTLKDKVEVILNTTATEVKGDGKKVTSVKLKNLVTNKESELKIDGFFLAIGHIPNTIFLKDLVKLDEEGFIVTDKLSQTSAPGVFAAGDVQDKIFKQAVTSAGTGCQAAIQAERYIENLKAKGEY